MCFSPLMTCQTNQPPSPRILTLPRARVRPQRPRAHCPPPPLSSRYTPTRTQTHTHTFIVSALPIQATDSGGSERERGVSRAASVLTPPQPSLSQCRSYVICICVHLAIWSMVCVIHNTLRSYQLLCLYVGYCFYLCCCCSEI